jgi:hypothetical protein
MITIFRQKDYLGITVFIAALLILVWFFIAKILLFYKLNYQSDLFSHIQTSRSWLEGRPIMFENNYGMHSKYHNYFFNLLMGPIVMLLGGYGIFLVQFLLYVLALFYSFQVLYKPAESFAQKLNVAVFYLAIFCGPYAFWLYDDPWFGFHTEMLYMPLGLLFAIALQKSNRWLAILLGVLIILVKEDGPVIAACIHILYFVSQWQAGKINQKQWLKKCLLWGGVYVLVFLAGMFYLKYKNDAGQDRLSKAFARIAEDTEAERDVYFTTLFKSFALLLLPLGTILVFLKTRKRALWLWWVLLMLPLVAVNLISGFVYFPLGFLSITWVPRFSLIFTLFLVLCAFILMQFPQHWFRPKFISLVCAVVFSIGLWTWQNKLLQSQKEYSFTENSIKIFTKPHPRDSLPYVRDIEKIAAILPKDYPVAPPYWMLAVFHKHDYLWITSAYNAWQKPRLVICDASRFVEAEPTKWIQHPDSIITKDVSYYFEKEERHYLIEAGIIEK